MRNFHRRSIVMAAALVVLALMWAVPLRAQGRGAGPGPRMYDVATETTIQGTVTEVKTMTSRAGGRGMQGTHVLVATGGGVLEVHLGPSSYLKEHGVVLHAGDVVTVLGSRVTMGDAVVVIARRVDSGAASWTLRDDTGRPAWAGRGRRGGW